VLLWLLSVIVFQAEYVGRGVEQEAVFVGRGVRVHPLHNMAEIQKVLEGIDYYHHHEDPFTLYSVHALNPVVNIWQYSCVVLYHAVSDGLCTHWVQLIVVEHDLMLWLAGCRCCLHLAVSFCRLWHSFCFQTAHRKNCVICHVDLLSTARNATLQVRVWPRVTLVFCVYDTNETPLQRLALALV